MKLSSQKSWPLICLVFVVGLAVGAFRNEENNPFKTASRERYNAAAELNSHLHLHNVAHGPVSCVLLPDDPNEGCNKSFNASAARCIAQVGGQYTGWCCHTGGRRSNRGCYHEP